MRRLRRRTFLLQRLKKEQGFTLIEILAAMLILAIVALAFTAYFNNAMTFSKSNQNKTIMSNLARSAIVYMQKQDFKQLDQYFKDSHAVIVNEKPSITSDTFLTCGASSTGVCQFKGIFGNTSPSLVSEILSPSVNGIDYQIVISYQQNLVKSADKGGDLLLPITATIRPRTEGRSGPGADEVTVEGYVNAEVIR
ncbi:hypothetical protein B9G55_10220 [Saccharibacillus sp. O16]|nr:hypothetical protein B9G55_10220 [Saccharibacillus sp. O16]